MGCMYCTCNEDVLVPCHTFLPRLQVQGVLMSAAERWPHIYISDSLVMADTAVKMANEGCT